MKKKNRHFYLGQTTRECDKIPHTANGNLKRHLHFSTDLQQTQLCNSIRFSNSSKTSICISKTLKNATLNRITHKLFPYLTTHNQCHDCILQHCTWTADKTLHKNKFLPNTKQSAQEERISKKKKTFFTNHKLRFNKRIYK